MNNTTQNYFVRLFKIWLGREKDGEENSLRVVVDSSEK